MSYFCLCFILFFTFYNNNIFHFSIKPIIYKWDHKRPISQAFLFWVIQLALINVYFCGYYFCFAVYTKTLINVLQRYISMANKNYWSAGRSISTTTSLKRKIISALHTLVFCDPVLYRDSGQQRRLFKNFRETRGTKWIIKKKCDFYWNVWPY